MKFYNEPVFEIRKFKVENIVTASSNDKRAIEVVQEKMNAAANLNNIDTFSVVDKNWN